jgi:hypothetical protein
MSFGGQLPMSLDSCPTDVIGVPVGYDDGAHLPPLDPRTLEGGDQRWRVPFEAGVDDDRAARAAQHLNVGQRELDLYDLELLAPRPMNERRAAPRAGDEQKPPENEPTPRRSHHRVP